MQVLQTRDENVPINVRPKRKISGEKVQEIKAMEIDTPKVSLYKQYQRIILKQENSDTCYEVTNSLFRLFIIVASRRCCYGSG